MAAYRVALRFRGLTTSGRRVEADCTTCGGMFPWDEFQNKGTFKVLGEVKNYPSLQGIFSWFHIPEVDFLCRICAASGEKAKNGRIKRRG